MIEMIKRLILLFKREKNWKERTSDVPRAFSVSNENLIEKVLSTESHAELIEGTHCCPTSTQSLLGGDGLLKPDRQTDYLEYIKNNVNYKR